MLTELADGDVLAGRVEAGSVPLKMLKYQQHLITLTFVWEQN